MAAGALMGALSAGAGSSFGNAGPSSNGDTVLDGFGFGSGPIIYGAPPQYVAGNPGGITWQKLAIVGAAAVAVVALMWRR